MYLAISSIFLIAGLENEPMRKDIPLSEVAQHKAPNDAWTVLNGKARRYSWCAVRVVTAAPSHNCFVERGKGGSRMRGTLAE